MFTQKLYDVFNNKKNIARTEVHNIVAEITDKMIGNKIKQKIWKIFKKMHIGHVLKKKYTNESKVQRSKV